jgi:hypothetical protein
MHVLPSTPAEYELERQLHALATTCPQHLRALGYWYDSPYHFLLQHGQWYTPRSLPSDIPLLAPKACFGNALVTALLKDLIYVEGYAGMSNGHMDVLAFHHAWCTNALGQLFDVTWPEPEVAYFGVQFSAWRADNCLWEGDATILWDHHRGFPLLRKPWNGEPEGIRWPTTPSMKYIQKYIKNSGGRERSNVCQSR